MKLFATFLAVSGAIKCRNRGIEHVTGSGEEFCECVDSFWGENCEDEDVSRGSKINCKYVHLNDEYLSNVKIATDVRKDYHCWVFYGEPDISKEHERIGFRIRKSFNYDGPPIFAESDPTQDLCENDFLTAGKCVINGEVVYDKSDMTLTHENDDWEHFWWQWEQEHGTGDPALNAKDPKKRKNFFFFNEHFNQLKRKTVEDAILHANMSISASNVPTEFFQASDIVTVIYRETAKLKDESDEYLFTSWSDVNECTAGTHNCDPVYGVCSNTKFGHDCSCIKGTFAKNGTEIGTECRIVSHLSIELAATDPLFKKIEEVEADLDFFVWNMTKTDQEIRDGITDFRDNMLAQKIYTITQLDTLLEQEMITDELQLKEILSNTAIIAKQVDDVENSMRTELRAYNANMDNLAKNTTTITGLDKQFAEIAERLLFDADTVLSSDISQMDNILDTTLDYLVRLQENMTMTDNNGVSPGQTAVESGIAGIESYWRGEVQSFKKSVEDIDGLVEDRFDFVKDQLQLLDSQRGKYLTFTLAEDVRKSSFRAGTVPLAGFEGSDIIPMGDNSILFVEAGYYLMTVNGKMSPNAIFQWYDVNNQQYIGRELGVLDLTREGTDIVTGSQMLAVNRCDQFKLEVTQGKLLSGTQIQIFRINGEFEGTAVSGSCFTQ